MIFNENGEIILESKQGRILRDIQSCIDDIDGISGDNFRASLKKRKVAVVLANISSVLATINLLNVCFSVFGSKIYTLTKMSTMLIASLITGISSKIIINDAADEIMKEIHKILEQLELISKNDQLSDDIRENARNAAINIRNKVNQL